MFKKIIMLLSILTIVNNINCAHGQFDINKFNISPLTKAEQKKFAVLSDEDCKCSICLNVMEFQKDKIDDSFPYKVGCTHIFHKGCIIRAAQEQQTYACSFCRTPFLLRPVITSQEWFRVIESEDINAIEILIKSRVDLDIKNSHGDTALMQCICNYDRDKNIIKLLIENGADINLQNYSGNTALLLAVCRDNKEAVELLMENEADVNIKNDKGHAALSIAIDHGYVEIVELLIANGADVNSIDYMGRSALKMADAKMAHMNKLLSKNEDPNYDYDYLNDQIISYENIVRLLIMSELPYGLVE